MNYKVIFGAAAILAVSACGASPEDACNNAVDVCQLELEEAYVSEGVAFDEQELKDDCIDAREKQEKDGDLQDGELDCYAEADNCDDVVSCSTKYD